MNYLVHGNWNEYAPLCNGDFAEYHQLLDDLSPLRSQILYLATQHLSNYYKGLEVVSNRVDWYFIDQTCFTDIKLRCSN
jgi:hypothetical protein